jgi:hypothetical protein
MLENKVVLSKTDWHMQVTRNQFDWTFFNFNKHALAVVIADLYLTVITGSNSARPITAITFGCIDQLVSFS